MVKKRTLSTVLDCVGTALHGLLMYSNRSNTSGVVYDLEPLSQKSASLLHFQFYVKCFFGQNWNVPRQKYAVCWCWDFSVRLWMELSIHLQYMLHSIKILWGQECSRRVQNHFKRGTRASKQAPLAENVNLYPWAVFYIFILDHWHNGLSVHWLTQQKKKSTKERKKIELRGCTFIKMKAWGRKVLLIAVKLLLCLLLYKEKNRPPVGSSAAYISMFQKQNYPVSTRNVFILFYGRSSNYSESFPNISSKKQVQKGETQKNGANICCESTNSVALKKK